MFSYLVSVGNETTHSPGCLHSSASALSQAPAPSFSGFLASADTRPLTIGNLPPRFQRVAPRARRRNDPLSNPSDMCPSFLNFFIHCLLSPSLLRVFSITQEYNIVVVGRCSRGTSQGDSLGFRPLFPLFRTLASRFEIVIIAFFFPLFSQADF